MLVFVQEVGGRPVADRCAEASRRKYCARVHLDESVARARFEQARVARLATVSATTNPHLVPVTFALRGDVVVIAIDHKPKTTTKLARLRNIRETSQVSLLADHYNDHDWSQLWWARLDGTARVLDEDHNRDEPVTWLCEKYSQYRDNPPTWPVIWVHVDAAIGWAYSD